MKKLDTTRRSKIWTEVSNQTFDLVIIGGGITGAGIAMDAASRGLSVALVEKQDFASGTSSRSTKLVHGGLRYLEHLELGIVHKVGRERETVYNNAPHIVIPEKMLLPIIKGGSLGEFTTSLALYVYDFLAGVKKEEQKQMLSREETIEKEPLVDSDMLEGGAVYYEYKTDDSRLVIEVLKRAAEYGTKALNYCQCNDFIYDDKGIVTGINVTDLMNGNTAQIKARFVVNAAGVWTDQLREKDNSLKKKRLHITKGVHIVVPKSKFNLNHSIYFDVGDNRMVFAIPRFDVVYIGTTDTNYTRELENPDTTLADVEYLITAVNHIAPSANLAVTDVESVWSGLRPLIHEDGKSPSELSRKDEIFDSPSGLISIAGGKLTGYRLMAKNVVDMLAKRIKDEGGTKLPKCKTKKIPLGGGNFPFEANTSKLIEYADHKYDEAKETGISIDDFKKLFYRYGTNIDKLIYEAFEQYQQSRNTLDAWTRAEVRYCIHQEMITSLSDFFVRRTGMIHFFVKDIPERMPIVLNEMQTLLKWTEQQIDEYTLEFKKEYAQATQFCGDVQAL